MLKHLVPVLALFPLAAHAEGEVTLKVLSFNIWYGGDQVSFAKVVEAIKLADADIVGLQEPDGKTLEIAAAAGYPYADARRHILSKYPIFDSGMGETTSTAAPPYSTAGVDPDAVHAWVQVAPGKVVAVANTHLTSDPYGPEMVRDGATPEEVLQNEADTRVPEVEALIAGLAPVIATGAPVILTGDFNSPSPHDWTEAALTMRATPTAPVVWPAAAALEAAGFLDSFRAANPDPIVTPGLTWTPGRPWPQMPEGETHDRIDFIFTANAAVQASLVIGEAGNPQNGLSVTPWPSDHRAVLTTLSVQPMQAPALITVEPRPVRMGDSFVVRVLSPGGAAYSVGILPAMEDISVTALTGIADVDPADRPTVRLSTIGLQPGPHDAVLFGTDGAELASHRFWVVADAPAEIALMQDKVVPDGDIALRFAGAPGFKLDWVGIYRAGEPSVYNYLGFAYTGARISGEMTFPAAELYESLTPGDYEARLMFDDHYRVMAVAPFTVTEP